MAAKKNADSQVMIRVDDPSEKRWTIMAAMLGTNTAFALFHGIAQQENYLQLRQIALLIVISAIPFQAVYFMVYAFVLEYSDRIGEQAHINLQHLASFCQVVAYLSISGIAIMFYASSWILGVGFTLSGLIALVLVRMAMTQAQQLAATE